MGVIDNEFKRLQDVVTALEERVKRLEQRQSGNSAIKIPEGGVRMILMGPPGAGMCPFFPRSAWTGDGGRGIRDGARVTGSHRAQPEMEYGKEWLDGGALLIRDSELVRQGNTST